MNQHSEEYPSAIDLASTSKVKSFSQFWGERADTDIKVADESGAITTPDLLQSHITTTTSNILLESIADIALFGIPSTIRRLSGHKKPVQEFSQDVSHYATSQEVIDEFSREIGPPHEYENEEQFVTRAKQTLKQMLRKRFRV